MATSKKPTTKPRTRRGSGAMQFLTQEELKRLFAVIRDRRDKVLFLLAYRHGLRASEIGHLQRADVDLKQGRITIHRLKGSLSGIYPLQPDVIELLRSYLRARTDVSPYLLISNRPESLRNPWYPPPDHHLDFVREQPQHALDSLRRSRGNRGELSGILHV